MKHASASAPVGASSSLATACIVSRTMRVANWAGTRWRTMGYSVTAALYTMTVARGAWAKLEMGDGVDGSTRWAPQGASSTTHDKPRMPAKMWWLSWYARLGDMEKWKKVRTNSADSTVVSSSAVTASETPSWGTR
eukprot:5052909-Prymnesium_polylepis.2